jgi:hypothetical protein
VKALCLGKHSFSPPIPIIIIIIIIIINDVKEEEDRSDRTWPVCLTVKYNTATVIFEPPKLSVMI